MDRTVDCQQIRLLITPAVDDRLEGADRLAFEEHLRGCDGCRRRFESELAVKRRIQSRIPHLSAPPELRQRIMGGIRELSRSERARMPLWKRFLTTSAVSVIKPVVLVSSAAIIVFLFVTVQPIASDEDPGSDRNLVDRSVLSYHALRSGVVVPQIVSSNPMRVQGYLAEYAECPVEVPLLPNFTLVGGLTDNFRGVHAAQIVYRRGGTFLAMTQVPLNAILRNNALSLPMNARNELLHRGRFTGFQGDSDAIVLWTRGTTLCTVVAHMNCSELESVMYSSDDTAGTLSAW